MDEGRQEVLLDREPAIRRLHPIRPAYARDLFREARLTGGVADVLDDRVAEDDVERLITEREHPAVACNPLSPLIFPGARCIQEGNGRALGDEFPDIRRPPDVEDARLGSD